MNIRTLSIQKLKKENLKDERELTVEEQKALFYCP